MRCVRKGLAMDGHAGTGICTASAGCSSARDGSVGIGYGGYAGPTRLALHQRISAMLQRFRSSGSTSMGTVQWAEGEEGPQQSAEDIIWALPNGLQGAVLYGA
jgi:hypothetical protein